jgi:circadian clock protein KaiC
VDARLPQSVVQGGEFDLLGLLAVLGQKVKAIRAKRIVLDGLDVLLANLGDPSLVRREVFRLREWLQDSRLTAILTGRCGRRSPVTRVRLLAVHGGLRGEGAASRR